MATTETALYTFTTLGELAADFTGTLELDAVLSVSGWDRVQVGGLEHGVGTQGLTRVDSPAFGEPGDEYIYLRPSIRVRVAK